MVKKFCSTLGKQNSRQGLAHALQIENTHVCYPDPSSKKLAGTSSYSTMDR